MADPNLASAKRKLASGEVGAALQEVDAVLAGSPDDPDALYLSAVALRFGGELDAALQTLLRLKTVAPSHSRAHQEEGHVHRDAGRADQALRAYSRAITLNPALDASLRESIKLLAQGRRERPAIRLQVQLDALLALPAELRTVMDLVAQNKLVKAEGLCRNFLRNHPDDVEAMRLLADIAVKLGVLDDAEFLLESAAVFAPDNLPVQLDYVQVLRKRQKFQAALDQARQLLERYPANVQVQSLAAIEHMQTGDFDSAVSLLDQVLEQVPGDPRTLVTYGHALKTEGRTSAAIERYQQAIDTYAEHGESYYALANLKTYRFDDAEIERMEALQRSGNLGLMDGVYVSFALAKGHEDAGRYEQAFRCYEQGNALKKAQSRYDADRMGDEMRSVASLCSREFFAERAGYGAAAPDPIFVVGLPRAGSTLLEQILASHSQVDGTLELPNILSLSQRLRRREGYPEALTQLSADECRELGETYLEETAIHRSGAPLFVDKMPNNFRHIGLIKLILPNAKIIDARREPMACCFSGFKQLFAEGQEFSYSLSDIGRYYRDYVALMAHWDDVLPGSVIRVQHEDVVADLDGQVRRLLDLCGLAFEPECLAFHETERSVRTPSSEQVRQPIFTDGLQQWRHFEPWLDPLKVALFDELTDQSTSRPRD